MIIYNKIIDGQWEDFDEALDACRGELDAYDIWDEFENCDSFSKVKIVEFSILIIVVKFSIIAPLSFIYDTISPIE